MACRCGARWSSLFAAHCASCHLTFASVDGYESHQPEGVCVPPESVGLRFDQGYWCRGGERSPNAARGSTVQGALFDDQ
jgi:hypothetical protein